MFTLCTYYIFGLLSLFNNNRQFSHMYYYCNMYEKKLLRVTIIISSDSDLCHLRPIKSQRHAHYTHKIDQKTYLCLNCHISQLLTDFGEINFVALIVWFYIIIFDKYLSHFPKMKKCIYIYNIIICVYYVYRNILIYT